MINYGRYWAINGAAISKNKHLTVGFDGWYGVEWDKIIDELKK